MRNSASLSVFNNFIGVSFCKVNGFWVDHQVLFLQDHLKRVRKNSEYNFLQTKQDNNKYFFGTWEKIFFLNAEWLLNWIDIHLQSPQCKFQRSHFLSFVYMGSPFPCKDWLHRSWIQALIRQSAMRSLKQKNCIYQLLFNWMF